MKVKEKLTWAVGVFRRVGAREMSAYLILLIAFLPAALVIRMLLIKHFKVDVKSQEHGVVIIVGSLVLGVLILGLCISWYRHSGYIGNYGWTSIFLS